MATILDCSIDTLQRNFAAEMKRGKAELCGSLRKAQIKNAISRGNAQMQIWLGRQLLKQTNGSLELTGPEGAPLYPTAPPSLIVEIVTARNPNAPAGQPAPIPTPQKV